MVDKSDIEHLRAGLISKVHRGLMSPQEAEREAAELGLGLLAQYGDIEKFDPFAEEYWTLAMSLAWIVFRSRDAVRNWWDAYRSESFDWVPKPGLPGEGGGMVHHLEQLEPATVSSVTTAYAYSQHSNDGFNPLMDFEPAQAGLLEALRNGDITAIGTERSSGKREQIGSTVWHGLDYVDDGGPDHTSPAGFQYRHFGFDDVVLPRLPLVGRWPARKPRFEDWDLDVTPVPEAPRISISKAAIFVATMGGSQVVSFQEAEVWKAALEEIVRAILDRKVWAFGVKNAGSVAIDSDAFRGCAILTPFDQTVDRGRPRERVLDAYPPISAVVAADHLSGDMLIEGDGSCWESLSLETAGVLRHWPFDNVAQSYRSGLAGRPSSAHLILEELMRRADEQLLEPTVRKQAEVLKIWLDENHPGSPRLQTRGIENRIRKEIKKAKSIKL